MMFPKPVRQEKKPKRLQRKSRLRALGSHPSTLPQERGLAHPKTTRIVDEALLHSYRGRPCAICGQTFGTKAHHLVPRGHQRLDVRENLLPLCFACHAEETDRGTYTLRLWAMKTGAEIATLRELAPLWGGWLKIR